MLALCGKKGLAPTDVLVYTVDLGAPGILPRRGLLRLLGRRRVRGEGPPGVEDEPHRDRAGGRPLRLQAQDLGRGAFFLELTLGMAELSPARSTEGETVFMEVEDTPREISKARTCAPPAPLTPPTPSCASTAVGSGSPTTVTSNPA